MVNHRLLKNEPYSKPIICRGERRLRPALASNLDAVDPIIRARRANPRDSATEVQMSDLSVWRFRYQLIPSDRLRHACDLL